MGCLRTKRVSNFAYPCRHCGKKHTSAFMANICFELDQKVEAEKEKKLVSLKIKK